VPTKRDHHLHPATIEFIHKLKLKRTPRVRLMKCRIS
jgi:hypothetical protein